MELIQPGTELVDDDAMMRQRAHSAAVKYGFDWSAMQVGETKALPYERWDNNRDIFWSAQFYVMDAADPKPKFRFPGNDPETDRHGRLIKKGQWAVTRVR